MLADRLGIAAFVASVCALSTLLGVTIAEFRLPPYQTLRGAYVVFSDLKEAYVQQDVGKFEFFSDVPLENLAAGRIQKLKPAASSNLLVFGGLYEFMDLCPGGGCLAVAYSGEGKVLHAYPYRPEEIFAANSTPQYPYEYSFFEFAEDSYPAGIRRYDNGDLLVVFHSKHIFPFGTGIARIDHEGRPVWYRFDYSHHWPTLRPDGRALVLGVRILQDSVQVPMPEEPFVIHCPSGRPYDDTIRVLGPDGALRREIPILQPLLKSPFRAVLRHSTDPCDPLHANFVDVVEQDLATSVDGLEVGDFLVSLRNISSFAFVSSRDGRIKRLVRGTFLQQHSVQQLEGSRLLIFDNQGGSVRGGPSRVLMYDLATAAEINVFPTPDTPKEFLPLYIGEVGQIDISPDRKQATVAFTGKGRGFEISIPEGDILRVYDHVHDVSSLDELPDQRHQQAGTFRLYGLEYIP